MRFQLDGHKLQYHPRLVADYVDGKPIAPLSAEISMTDACNHRCLFCNFDYLGHTNVALPRGRMQTLMVELAEAGVRAVAFGGAGEPLLHPDTIPSVEIGKKAGLDVAMSTNGALLSPESTRVLAESLSWIRFSVNAGTEETYSRVHRCNRSDFGKTCANISRFADMKRRAASETTLGTQCVLMQENHSEIIDLAKRMRDSGADYFVVKHYYPREESAYSTTISENAALLAELSRAARELSTERFAMVVRDEGKLKRTRPYAKCLGLPFLVYIRENGLLYTCFSHQEDEKTAVGDLLKHGFSELWFSEAREAAVNYVNAAFDKNACQANCRHHQINLWLSELANPPAHVNFV